jgi:hypothetical protein
MNNPSAPINQPLRKDRARDDAWIKSYLQKVPFHSGDRGDGQPSSSRRCLL